MRQAVVIAGMLLLGGAYALGEPYEVASVAPECEACSAEEGLPGPFPEDQGWTRFAKGVTRSVENGALHLEATEDSTVDFYRKEMNNTLNPGPGEYFDFEWRMVVDFASTGYDTPAVIALDNFGGVLGIQTSDDHVRDAEGGEWYWYDPGVFHTFLLRSVDLVNYDLFVDSQYAFSDVFKLPTGLNSFAGWGDSASSHSSSRWEFARFGAAALGDLDRNGLVNLLDFATFANCFGVSTGVPSGSCSDLEAHLSDMDGNGTVNLNDFATFAGDFGG